MKCQTILLSKRLFINRMELQSVRKREVMKMLYFKPTEQLHDSGYRMIEVGYLDEFGEKSIVGLCSDVINFGFAGMHKMPKELNIDITLEGYINIWSDTEELEWKLPVLSNAIVVVIKRKE